MLIDDNAVHVNFLLTASEATKNAELTALELVGGKHINASQRQIKAYEYFVLLRDAEFFVDLHEEIPHLKGAMNEPSWPGSPLAKKFALLDSQQKAMYMHGFNKLLCGICILPGGPGAGKTHFNLFTIAMAQSKPLPRPFKVNGQLAKRCAKVLFIVDMNSPVDDVANRMVRLYDELGMKKSIIRMKGWGSEVKSSGKLNAAEDAASGEELMQVDFSNQFLRIVNLMALGHGSTVGQACKAPSLDEAAWQRYGLYKATKYEELTTFLAEELWQESEVLPLRFRRLVYNLYRDTLAAADFIATTPVAASNHFRGMFKPDLVYFDESPHARELSNLIAIANFDPIAWIFCGDYRQTVPFVGSDTLNSPNIYREQMQVSMMERAAVSNAIRYELLMNHRAFGGLHELASSLWYGGRMISGTQDRTPVSLSHVQKYLGRFKGGWPCVIPRLLVHISNCGPEGREGTSAWNPTHTAWVMARVRELINNENFRHADRNEAGTILIISPYKKAYNEYKNAIKDLPRWAQRRVETRTVDVVQGHEADFVFLDLVKEKSTRFLDDPNRLCVAVTRARLGEVIMMHPNMVRSTTFLRNSQNLRRIYTSCKAADQVVFVDAEPAAGFTTSDNFKNAPIGMTSVFNGMPTAYLTTSSKPEEVHPSWGSAADIVNGNVKTDTSLFAVSADEDKEVVLPQSLVEGMRQDIDAKLVIQEVAPAAVSCTMSKKSSAKEEDVENIHQIPNRVADGASVEKSVGTSVQAMGLCNEVEMSVMRLPVSGKPGPQHSEVFSGGGALAMLSAVLTYKT
jgi:regulator of nonsense transcripts 1